MLIITADDYGETFQATERILECSRQGRLTCASAMVFMADSERAASLARRSELEFGLHLNLTEAFTAPGVAESIRQHHSRVARYLNSHRFAQAIFNPFLAGACRALVDVQWSEFKRLYGREPEFVNGHHHMHLCANVIGARLLPRQTRLRVPFTFLPGEKGVLNRSYRRLVDRQIRKSFVAPDCLYNIQPLSDTKRLPRIAAASLDRNVELEVHPELQDERQTLLSPAFRQLLTQVELGRFRDLPDIQVF